MYHHNMDKYYEFYCNPFMRTFEEGFKKQQYFYIPANFKDMEVVVKNDRFFKGILKKAKKYLKVNKKFIGNERRY